MMKLGVALRWDGAQLSQQQLTERAARAVDKAQAHFSDIDYLDIKALPDVPGQYVQLIIETSASAVQAERMAKMLKDEFVREPSVPPPAPARVVLGTAAAKVRSRSAASHSFAGLVCILVPMLFGAGALVLASVGVTQYESASNDSEGYFTIGVFGGVELILVTFGVFLVQRLLRGSSAEIEDANQEGLIEHAAVVANRRWFPDERVKDHQGNKLPDDLDFFVAPPEEIGTICDAFSTMKRGERPMALPIRLGWLLLFAVVGSLPGLAVVHFLNHWTLGWLLGCVGTSSGISALLVLAITSFMHSCSYVGSDGIARFSCWGARDKIDTREILVFQPNLNCNLTVLQHSKQETYLHHSYSFECTDSGQQVFTIKGDHHAEDGNPPMDTSYWLAVSAYGEWKRYCRRFVCTMEEMGGCGAEIWRVPELGKSFCNVHRKAFDDYLRSHGQSPNWQLLPAPRRALASARHTDGSAKEKLRTILDREFTAMIAALPNPDRPLTPEELTDMQMARLPKALQEVGDRATVLAALNELEQELANPVFRQLAQVIRILLR